MSDIYIVNHAISGPYAEQFSSYHHTEDEAREAFENCKLSVGEDPSCIDLVRLDTVTLETVSLDYFEGTMDDVEHPEDFEDEDSDEDDDDS